MKASAVYVLYRLAVGIVIALVFAALQAPFRRAGFERGFVVGCYVTAGLFFLMAVGGPVSYRSVELPLTFRGRMPGWRSYVNAPAGDRSLSTGAVFVLTGLTLVGIGVAVGSL